MSTEDFFQIYDVPGDGDCLFSSISDQIMQETGEEYNLSASADKLRSEVIRHLMMMNNPEEIFILSIAVGKSLPEYIDEMARKYTYGDYICIAVIAKILQRNIYVWNKDGKIIHSENIDNAYKIYNIMYLADELHYKSARVNY